MNKNTLTLGSLFSGSGGFELGGILAGIKPVFNAEVEPFPIRVTTKRLLGVKHYVDSNMPDWAKPTIKKMIQKGYLQGDTSGRLGLTDELLRVFVINDRAGVYGE